MLDDRAWDPPDRWIVAQNNLERLRLAMREKGLDALFLNRSDAVRYVAGTIPSDNLIFSQRVACLVLADKPEPILFAQSHAADFLRNHFWISDIRPLPRLQDSWPALVEQTLKDYGLDAKASLIGLDPTMEAYPFELLRQHFPKASCLEAAKVLARCRAIKSAAEQSCIEHACIIGEMAIDVGARMLQIGVTEIELAAEMSRVSIAAGAEGLYARRGTAVTSGTKMARHDETPSRRRLRYGDFVLIDVGPIIAGYYTDFARTIAVGMPSQKARRAYSVAYDAMQLALELFKPGEEGAPIARRIVKYIGSEFPEAHASGLTFVAHGVGTASQEAPYFVPAETTARAEGFERLEPGMVLSLSVGVYDGQDIGCRQEEVVTITQDGNTVLSRSPYYGFQEVYLADGQH